MIFISRFSLPINLLKIASNVHVVVLNVCQIQLVVRYCGEEDSKEEQCHAYVEYRVGNTHQCSLLFESVHDLFAYLFCILTNK